MRRTVWIWAVGCIAWTVDAIANLHARNLAHSELALLLAIMFGIAFGFFRAQNR